MRNPNRIPEVLALLGAYCLRHPDFRLGQIVGNASMMHNGNPDPFYLEDDDLIVVLNDLIANSKGAESHDNGNNIDHKR